MPTIADKILAYKSGSRMGNNLPDDLNPICLHMRAAAGVNIYAAASAAVTLSLESWCDVILRFNDVDITILIEGFKQGGTREQAIEMVQESYNDNHGKKPSNLIPPGSVEISYAYLLKTVMVEMFNEIDQYQMATMRHEIDKDKLERWKKILHGTITPQGGG